MLAAAFQVAGPFVADNDAEPVETESTAATISGDDDGSVWTYDELSQQAGLSVAEVKGLHKRFRALDTDRSGTLEINEFSTLLNHAPLARPLFRAMDVDHSGALSFPELLRAVSLQRKSPEQRCRLFFNMVDADNNGHVSFAELVAVIALVEPNAQLEAAPEHRYTKAVYQALGDGSVRLPPLTLGQGA